MKMEERKRCIKREDTKSTDSRSLFHLFQLSRLDHSIRFQPYVPVQYISTANGSIVGHHYPGNIYKFIRERPVEMHPQRRATFCRTKQRVIYHPRFKRIARFLDLHLLSSRMSFL